MNKSQLLVAPDAIQYLSPDDQKYAQIYLKKEYPGIIYHSEIDSYEYRGIMFDYFKSGTRFDLNGSLNGNGSYLLIDKDDPKLWLFTYGNQEERWNDYIKTKNKWTIQNKPKSLWT